MENPAPYCEHDSVDDAEDCHVPPRVNETGREHIKGKYTCDERNGYCGGDGAECVDVEAEETSLVEVCPIECNKPKRKDKRERAQVHIPVCLPVRSVSDEHQKKEREIKACPVTQKKHYFFRGNMHISDCTFPVDNFSIYQALYSH